jgi:hypothetical protein
LSLAWLVFFGAGVRQADWNAAMLFLGATALFYWSFRSGQTPPRIPLWQAVALWALPAYAAFQLIPLPSGILQALSPARYLITGSLASILPNVDSAPISVAPAAAMFGLFGLLAYLTVFSLIRDLEWRFAVSNAWLPVAPLGAIAAIEACIGVGQWIAGTPSASLRGTLSSVEHFAGLLEVALPFTIVFGYISFRQHQTRQTQSSKPAIRAAAAWFAALMIILALFHSPSQTSHVVVLSSLFILACFALIPRLKTKSLRFYGIGVAVFIGITIFLIAAPPTDFVDSWAELGASDKAHSESRMVLWNSSASLLGEYHWFGTGLGGFESAFLKYQGSTDLSRIQSPHNDLLALLITFGIVGSCIAAVALVGVVRPAIMGAIYLPEESRRLLAVSVTAALFGVLLRSCLESAISLPVVAMAFAWVAGLSQSSGLD